MKTLVGLALVAVAACGLSLAASRNAPDRPPGIAADQWASISSTMGVVLVPDSELSGRAGPAVSAPMDRTVLFSDPSPAVQAIIEEGYPVRGYLMVKRGKVWRPLNVVAPSVSN
jgi:acid phosphatase class B